MLAATVYGFDGHGKEVELLTLIGTRLEIVEAFGEYAAQADQFVFLGARILVRQRQAGLYV